MSFDIFAAGTNFHLPKRRCEDGSTFDVMQTIGILQSLDVSSLGHLAITGTGGAVDSQAKGITDLMTSLAMREMLHNISNAVCIVAMNPNAKSGWIYVSATEENTLWANTVRAAKYSFSPGNSPGAEFVRKIEKCLTETSMNNLGVLQVLSVVLTKFSQKIDDSMTPMLNINLTN